MRSNKNLRLWFDRCLGTLYLTLGIRLAISKMD
ncbi:MAG: hypothetical protein ACI8XC_004349 [Gammaproteobacteria bacterium]